MSGIIIIAAVEDTDLPPGKHSAFTPFGYGSTSEEPLVIPEWKLKSVYVDEGRFEEWFICGEDAGGGTVKAKAMREPIR